MFNFITMLVAAILILSGPEDTFAARKKTAKDTKSVKTILSVAKTPAKLSSAPIDGEKASNFSETPYSMIGNKIHPNYLGHDLRKIYDLLEIKKIRQKSEFETTAQFKARIVEENKLPLLGSIYNEDQMALVCKVAPKYDADNNSFRISLLGTSSYSVKIDFGVGCQIVLSSDRTRKGGNLYGAMTEIEESSRIFMVLVFSNSSSFPINHHKVGDTIVYSTLDALLNDIDVEKAKNLHENAMALVVFKLDNSRIDTDNYYKKPTMDSPRELTILQKYVYGKIAEVIFYDRKSGEVLHKFKEK